MKDEIKEILEYLKCEEEYYDGMEEVVLSSNEKVIERDDIELLLDYITNLQEIEKEHKNCTRKHWQQKCAEHCANEMIYKSRNEKAIEMFNNENLNKYYYGMSYEFEINDFKEDMLNILQGEDKDVKDKR